MKTQKENIMKRTILSVFSVLAILAGLSLCHKPETSEADALKRMVLDENGQIIFDRTIHDGPYQIGVEDVDAAALLTRLYVGDGFNGEEYTRTLSGNQGTVQVRLGVASVFYALDFNVDGIPSFTLFIKDARTMGDIGTGHSGTYHRCNTCGFVWRSASSICPMSSTHAH